jgi:hypothetical protein
MGKVIVEVKLTNLFGQVPLEVLDLVVDSRKQRLIPNPEHGGEQMTEEYWMHRGFGRLESL